MSPTRVPTRVRSGDRARSARTSSSCSTSTPTRVQRVHGGSRGARLRPDVETAPAPLAEDHARQSRRVPRVAAGGVQPGDRAGARARPRRAARDPALAGTGIVNVIVERRLECLCCSAHRLESQPCCPVCLETAAYPVGGLDVELEPATITNLSCTSCGAERITSDGCKTCGGRTFAVRDERWSS